MKEKNIKFHLQGFLWLFSVSPGDDMDVRTEQVNRSSVLVKWNLQLPGSSPDVHLLGCWTKEVRLKPEAGFSKEILSSLLVFCWWLKQTYTGIYCLYKSQMQALRALVCKDVCTDLGPYQMLLRNRGREAENILNHLHLSCRHKDTLVTYHKRRNLAIWK